MEVCVNDGGIVLPHPEGESRDSDDVVFPANVFCHRGLGARLPGTGHERVGRIGVVQQHRAPAGPIQARDEMQNTTLGSSEHVGVAEMEDGPNHVLVGVGRDVLGAAGPPASAARAPNQ